MFQQFQCAKRVSSNTLGSDLGSSTEHTALVNICTQGQSHTTQRGQSVSVIPVWNEQCAKIFGNAALESDLGSSTRHTAVVNICTQGQSHTSQGGRRVSAIPVREEQCARTRTRDLGSTEHTALGNPFCTQGHTHRTHNKLSHSTATTYGSHLSLGLRPDNNMNI